MDEKVYKLKYPVKVGEHYCEELRFTRPKTKDFIAVGTYPLGTVAADVALLASITGQPEIVIKQIDIDDLAKLRYECSRIWAAYFDTTDGYTLNPITPEAVETEPETNLNP
ncbi:MAG: phage tail assembly protein [Spirochaetaceae bacterium]|jgi:hypothetical protein|nr:phage tail assembly protein [Spirochaetaceae bacterium]